MNDVDIVKRLIEKGKDVIQKPQPPSYGSIGPAQVDVASFAAWKSQSLNFLAQRFSYDNEYYQAFISAVKLDGYLSSAQAGVGILESISEDLSVGLIRNLVRQPSQLNYIESLCNRFHIVARQLRSRHNGRETLNIRDEYDVQDLLHALLQIHFDDIRAEEVCPSYAGKSARVDFLLKRERIVVETKMTREGLGAKELGSQLIEDVARYATHPDCDTLLCFIYDPLGLVANPRGLEDDLERADSSLKVVVRIRPM